MEGDTSEDAGGRVNTRDIPILDILADSYAIDGDNYNFLRCEEIDE